MGSLPLRAPQAFLPLVVSALLLAAGNLVGAQVRRVDTEMALSHVVKKVDAVVPDEARARKIGGPVIADVTIDARGKVSSLTMLSGPELLRPAAESALRQWVFKPFTTNGRPGSVQAILEIDFPDPLKDEADRHLQDFRSSVYQCKRQLEIDASKAEAVCAAAVSSADLLPPDRVLDRGAARADHAHALMAGGRVADAILEVEGVDEMRHRVSRGPDAGSAGLHQLLADLHLSLGEKEKADAEYAAAIAEYTAALQHSPVMQPAYASGFRSALTRYAAFKRSIGDAAAASELDARAAAVTTAEPAAPLPTPIVTRTVGGVDIREPADERLSDEDLDDIQAVLASAGKKPWRLQVRISSVPRRIGDASSVVYAFFEPDVATRTFRRGAAALGARLPVLSAKDAHLAWQFDMNGFEYIQLATGAGDAASEVPIPVGALRGLVLKDEDLVSIVRLIRRTAASKATDNYRSDIQPWPIAEMSQAGNDGVSVTLADPASEDHLQLIRLRRTSGQWSVVETVEAGRRPLK